MSAFGPKSVKPSKEGNQSSSNSKYSPAQSSSSLSTHLAMVELKQRIITSLSKLADRDTHQIALEDLHSVIENLSPEALPMLLNSLYDSLSDQSNFKPTVKKDALLLLSFTCESHKELTFPHLTRIISHIVKRLKDPDSGVREACRDAIGALSGLYLKGGGVGESGSAGDGSGTGSVVGLFVKPLFEAMAEQNKVVQSGAAMCMAKMVECAAAAENGSPDGGGVAIFPVGAFQKLCPRICKLLSGQNFLAKASLLVVITSLSQVGAIAQQGLEPLLQGVNHCLTSSDWSTRKAAAEALIALALHSNSFVTEGAITSTLTALEACRFDKIKPVRDCMTEALQSWKQIADKKDGSSVISHKESLDSSDKSPKPADRKPDSSPKPVSVDASSDTVSDPKSKVGSIPDKTVVILKKKAPALSDKELNPEFFQKLETKGSGELPVEVVVPRRYASQSGLTNDGESEQRSTESKGKYNRLGNSLADNPDGSSSNKHRNLERGLGGKDLRGLMGSEDIDQREISGRANAPKFENQSENSSVTSKGNLLAIQRQLFQLERQQANILSMLQDFMGGSHDSMVTLESRVRGLERVVEDMARDLSISSGRRCGNYQMGGIGKYNSLSDYSNAKYNGRLQFGERYTQSDANAGSFRGRGSLWRSDISDAASYGSTRNGHVRQTSGSSSKAEHELDQVGNRRAWEKGAGSIRLGEGPSARSVWQASKDEATLEAIRVAGEDGGLARTARAGIPELTAEAMGDELVGPERDPIWNSWSNAMDALKMGDIDTAYAEVLSTGDDMLLVKLMDRTGPTIDHLTNETACDVLYAIAQFLPEQNLYDVSLSWIHQLVEIVENSGDSLGIPIELKKELLLSLHDASTQVELPEDWESASPDQFLLQLASAWGIEVQQFDK